MTKPSEEIQAAARRGMKILQEGIGHTNAYDRTNFSDLRVYYNNLFQVARHAAAIETALSRIGVDFEDHSGDDEEVSLETLERYIRDTSGVHPISRGPLNGVSALATNYSSQNSATSGTPRVRLKSVTVRLNGIQQTKP